MAKRDKEQAATEIARCEKVLSYYIGPGIESSAYHVNFHITAEDARCIKRAMRGEGFEGYHLLDWFRAQVRSCRENCHALMK